jgi:hypothetical protein
VFGCSRLIGALLDRLTHHVHILEMNGPSYRLVDKAQPVKGAATGYSGPFLQDSFLP